MMYSWGRGEDGQLGLGDTNDQYRPVPVDVLKDRGVVQICCGSGHTVVLSGTAPLLAAVGVTCSNRDGCLNLTHALLHGCTAVLNTAGADVAHWQLARRGR